MSIEPHHFWQKIYPEGTYNPAPESGFTNAFPASLPDGRQILLPLREIEGGAKALCSLIINQASYEVQDGLAKTLHERIDKYQPDMIVGIPTLGLPLAENVSRRLGHQRMVPLGTSRKFWYDDALSVPMNSITSPNAGKRLFIDPRMLPLLSGKRVALIDDVLSSGNSMNAALSLLAIAGIKPVVIGVAMLQGNNWENFIESHGIAVESAIASPVLVRGTTGAFFA